MIRLVFGLVILFLGLAMATVLLVHAVRKKRAAKRLSRPFETKKHAGSESTYWQKKCAPDVTKAVTRTSGLVGERPTFGFSAAAWVSEVRNESDYFLAPKPAEEWAPLHPLGWRVVKVDGIHYAVSSRCPADVQRYSLSMLGWVKEEDLGAWGEAVWASIQLPPMGQA